MTIVFVQPGDTGRSARTGMLAEAGYRVLETASGTEALRLVAVEQAGVVILSAPLPDIGLADVCRAIKHGAARPAPMVLVLASEADADTCREMPSHADGLLIEPVHPRELAAQVRFLARVSGAEASPGDRTDEALRRGEAILAQAGRMANLGAWHIEVVDPDDMHGNRLEWSDQVYRIFGYEPGEVTPTNALFYERVHPDDRARVADAVVRALAEHRSYSIEHRIVRPDGTERIVREHADIDYDERGRPHHLTGAVQDITESKRAEQALRDSEALLQQERAFLRTIIDSVSSLIVVRDADGRILLANEPAARFHGMAAASLEGRYAADIRTFPKDVLDEDRQVLEGGREIPTEVDVLGADGLLHSFMTSRTPLVNGDGVCDRVLATGIDITWRKRAHRALNSAHARLQRMFSSNVVGMVIGEFTGRVLEANDYYLDLLGFTRDDLNADRVRWDRVTPPEHRSADERALAELRDGGACSPYEKEYVRADGSRVWVLIANALLPDDQILAFVLNITDRKRAEQRLAALQQLTAALSAALTPEQVSGVVLTEGARVLGARVAVVALLVDGMSQLQVRSSIHGAPDARDPWVQYPLATRVAFAQAARTGETVLVASAADYEAAYPDGIAQYHALELGAAAAAPLKIGDRILGSIGFSFAGPREFSAADVSVLEAIAGQTALAMERARFYETAERRAADLREADRRKDEFIAVLSHELRNPLAAIRYALPPLERGDLPHHESRSVAVIDRQVKHLARMLDDLLDVARITRGTLELKRELVTLESVVREATDMAWPSVSGPQHAFELALARETIWLDADPARLSQVVTNLLNNAARYTPPRGRIRLEAGRENGYAVIRVRDNGVGIPSDSLRSVFEMFRQVNRGPHSIQQCGLGIGLAISKQLVELHGGSIEARSNGPQRGAEFVVWLPLAEQGADAAPFASGISPEQRADRLKVLIVDDNSDLVDMLELVVSGLGHDVRKALDGGTAVTAAVAFSPDVVLLDLGLPVLSGLEVARELRRRPETAHARLVALTGWGQAEDRSRTREAGFDHHLTKPADPDMLERLLGEFARNRC